MSGQQLHNLDGVITEEAELARPGSTRRSFQLHAPEMKSPFFFYNRQIRPVSPCHFC